MIVNEEKCNMCRLCVDVCHLENIVEVDEKIKITENCVNTHTCMAAQICPQGAIEYDERPQPKGSVRCVLCPVACFIHPGKTGECRCYTNINGEVVRRISATPYEEAEEFIGEDPDPVIRTPLLTGIGAGIVAHRYYPDKAPQMGTTIPYLVEDKVNGVEVVTGVSECQMFFSGVKVKIDTERYIGEEGADVLIKGTKVGMVLNDEYGSHYIYLGGVNQLSGKNGWLAAKAVAEIANRERVKVRVKGGPELELQVGKKPVVNKEEMEKRRWGCGGETGIELWPIVEGIVDELIIFDRGLTGWRGEPNLDNPWWGAGPTKTGATGGLKVRFMAPCGWIYPHVGGPGWGMTPMQDPMEIIESYDPKKLKPGFKLLFTETCADRVALYQLNRQGKFEQVEMSPELKRIFKEFRERCEPARVSAYYFGGAGGTARRSITKTPFALSKAFMEKKACLTVGGAPAEYLWGGGIGFMVNVERVKPGSFYWTPTPCTAAPIEWTMKKADFIAISGYEEKIRPLKEVLKEIKTERSA